MRPRIPMTCLVLCGVTACVSAQAAGTPSSFTGNVTVASQYVYRGLANSSGNPAVQAGFKYSHPDGFYAGVFGSNSSWIPDGYAPGSSHSLETDLYLGWQFSVAHATGIDVGVLHYAFPGHAPPQGYAAGTTSPDTDEVYMGVSWRWVSLKYSYALDDAFGTSASRGSDYLDLTVTAPLGDSGFSLSAHAGRQRFRGTNAPLWPAATGCTNRCLSYTDFSLGLTRTWFGADFGVAFTHTNARGLAVDGTPVYDNRFGDNIGRSHWIFTVAKSF